MTKIGLLPMVAMTGTMIMILLYVAGNEIGGGETPMKIYSIYLPEDFLLHGTGIKMQSFYENLHFNASSPYIKEEPVMKEKIRRGDVFFVDLGKTVGSIQGHIRPVIVLQNDIGNKHSPTIIVATITGKSQKKRTMPTHIIFNMSGLMKESVVQLEQITTIDKQQIKKYVGTMPDGIMEKINDAIKISLALN